MSPIVDSRWADARRKAGAGRDADDSASARREWLVPLALLLAGLAVVTSAILWRGSESGGPPAPLPAALYPVKLAIEVFIGLLGLWVACALWLGGAGPLGLGLLRLAGIYAVYDAIVLALPFSLFDVIIGLVVYVALLARLFDLEATEAALLVIITFALKFVIGLGLMALLAGP